MTVMIIHFLSSLRPFMGLASPGGWEEKMWQVQQVNGSRATMLDVGGSESIFRLLLLPSFLVYALDVRFLSGIDSNWSIRGDAMKMPFRDDGFDYVILGSTIEHIGLGVYGDPENTEGDLLTIKEAKRIIKSNGRLIITTPYSTLGGRTWCRYYSEEMLNELLTGFRILKKEYLLKDRNSQTSLEKDRSGDVAIHSYSRSARGHCVYCRSKNGWRYELDDSLKFRISV